MTFAMERESIEKILEPIAIEVTLPKDARFERQNVYYLKQGFAALTHLTLKGEQSSFLYFKAGMLLNFLPPIIMETGIGTDFTVKRFASLDHVILAKNRCTALCMNGKIFLDYVEKNPQLYKLLLRSVSENLINALALSTDLSTKPAGVRVCQLLLDFMYEGENGEPPQIPRYLTYNEIAFYLSMHVITVTKIFKALKQNGIITKKGRITFVTDREQMLAIGEGLKELKY